jgi:tetratricopeptide (TPR) repeat protein
MSADSPPSGEERGAEGRAPGATLPPAARLAAELRRRGVVRAVVGYGVFALAALQVAEPILHALRLPDAWLTVVVVLLGLGFPLTAALSWAFDLTRRGIVRTADAAPTAPGAPRSSRLAQVGVIALAAALGAALSWLALRPPTPPVDADGRVSVAVADFANQTGEPALDALSGLLITSLEQSRRLKVLTRGRMFDLLRQAGREKVEQIDESAAREVGLRARVRALLLASVVKLGGAYVVELRALDPASDHYLFTIREQAADQAGILPLIDRLSERVRGALRETAEEVRLGDVTLAEAVTPNLEAYRHYFKGKELRARLEEEAAAAEFQAALKLEPGFSLAQLELALIGLFYGHKDREILRTMGAGAQRLPAKEREIVLGFVDLLEWRFVDVAARGRRLVERFPDDLEVLLAASQFAPDEAASYPLLQRILLLAPDHSLARFYVTLAAVSLGRSRELLEAAVAEEARRPTAGNAAAVGLARLGTGDARAALVDFQRSTARAPTRYALTGTAFALVYQGEVEAVRKLGVTLPPLEAGFVFAMADARQGRLEAILGPLEAAAKLPGLQGDAFRMMGAGLAGVGGDLARAHRLAAGGIKNVVDAPFWVFAADGPERRRALERLVPGSLPYRMVAAVDRREAGDLDGAVAALGPLDGRQCGLEAWLLGMLESDRGHHAEAVALLRRFQGCLQIGWPGFIQLLRGGQINARIARALAAQGQVEEGRRLLARQLEEWRTADPGLPLLLEVKAACRELRCQGP